MAVREFDTVDDLMTMSIGSLGAFGASAWSIIVIVKPGSPLTNGAYVSVGVGTTSLISSLWNNGDGSLNVATAGEYVGGASNQAASVWQILGVGKPAGTSNPHFHRKELGAGSWTHVTSGGTIANNATTADIIGIGCWANSNRTGMRIASAACYIGELSQANFESVQTTPSTQQLLDLGADALWDFNQASTATDVLDLVGSAHQASLTGTTVVGGDDPSGWTFGVSGPSAVGRARSRPLIRV